MRLIFPFPTKMSYLRDLSTEMPVNLVIVSKSQIVNLYCQITMSQIRGMNQHHLKGHYNSV